MTDNFPPGGANPYQSNPAPGQPPATSGKAIASLILGLCSMVLCCVAGIPAIIVGAFGLGEINRSGGKVTGSGLAIAGIVLGSVGSLLSIVGILIGLLLPAVQAARNAARQVQSANNLKQVALALLNYHEVDQKFPPAYTKDDDGHPLLSWRVAILPYLEEMALEQRFDQDEAWDGPDNKPLADLCPSFYKSAADDTNPGNQTNILGIVDSDTVLSADGSVNIRDIRDGTSNTIVAVELAGADIVWSEPRDITIDELLAAMRRGTGDPGLHPVYAGKVQCMFADGSVRSIPTDTDPATLRGLCTRSGQEQVSLPY
jgi:type II secretory pathway pseudopilin PulG